MSTPDGVYMGVEIAAAGFGYMGQNPAVVVSFKFPTGEIHQWKGRTSGNDRNGRLFMDRTLSDLRAIGCTDPRRLGDLVGKKAPAVKIQNSGKWVNCYIETPKRVMTPQEQQALADELAARMRGGPRAASGQNFGNDEDEIPF